MVREKRDPLPLDEGDEVMRRLGALIRECSKCGQRFNGKQKPFHYVTTFVDGEIVDTDDPFIFCSEECAVAVVEERNQTEDKKNPEHNTDHLYTPSSE